MHAVAKPGSSREMLTLVRKFHKFHKLHGVEMPAATQVSSMLREVVNGYVLEHGADCLAIRRKEPLMGAEVRQIVAACSGKTVRGSVVD